MLLMAFVLILIGWMLLYSGFRNVSIKSQVLWAFGNR